MTLIKKATASLALLALTSGMFVNGTSAYSTSEVEAAIFLAAKWIVKTQENVADYELDRQVLRQEIAALARGRADVEKTTTCENMFRDVSATRPNTWACYTVEALANAGLIAKNTNFRPEAKISKAEAIGMIVKAAYGNEYSPEAGKGDWQKQVVDFAVSKGIVSPFTDYKTPAKRGFVFDVTRNTYKEVGVKDAKEENNLICDLLGECPKDEKEPTKKPEANNNVRPDSNLVVTLSPESPSNGMVAAGTPRAKMLAFDVTAGKEDVTLKKATLKFTGTGDSQIVKDLAIYSNDVKLTKNDEAIFNPSKLTVSLWFDRNVVIKAGETKTLFVTANIKPTNTYNQAIRVSLTNLEASSNVEGAELAGAVLTPYLVQNKGAVTADSVLTQGNLYIGKEDTIYTLNLRETSKKEDVVVKSIAFEKSSYKENEGKVGEKTISNSFDLDNLSNLYLTINGKRVNAEFTYQKDKIVASLNETIKSSQRITLALRGEATDDLNKKLVLKATDIYLEGSTSGTAIDVTKTGINNIVKTVTGTSLNFSFNKEGSNEVSPNSDDIKVGELVFVTNTNYLADVTVSVSWNGYSNLELNSEIGKGVENEPNTFVFKDVVLNNGTTKLPLTIDVNENATGRLTFRVSVNNVRDENLDEKVEGVLNNTVLSKTVNVVASSLTITDKKVNVTKVTPKNNPEVVLYKGSINVNGSEDITINNMIFSGSNDNASIDLQKTFSWVTLNIGGKTFNGNVSANKVFFNSIFATIEKGSKNVEFLVSWVLSDRDLAAKEEVVLNLLEEVSLSAEKTTPKSISNKKLSSTSVNLEGKVTLEITQSNDSSKTVVAGSNNAIIGSFKLGSTSADIYVDNLVINYTDTPDNLTKISSLGNLRLMDWSKELARWTIYKFEQTLKASNATNPELDSRAAKYNDGESFYIVNGWLLEKYTVSDNKTKTSKVVYSTDWEWAELGKDVKLVSFENFTLPMLSKTTTLSIVADLPAITTDGGLDSTFVWKVGFTNLLLFSEDAFAKAEVNTKEITVVPSKVTISLVDGFKDNTATVKVFVSKDNASEFDSVVLEELKLAGNASKILTIRLNGKDLKSTDGNLEDGKFKVEGDLIKLKEDISNLSEFNLEFVSKYGADTEKVANATLEWVKIKLWAYSATSADNNTVTLGSYTDK